MYLDSSLENIIWPGVTANEKERFLVVLVLGGLFAIRTHIVDAVVIARILEASFVFPVLNGDERWSTIAAKLLGRNDKEITHHWHTYLKNALSIQEELEQLLQKEAGALENIILGLR